MDVPDLARLASSSLFGGVDVVALANLLKATPYSVRSWAPGAVVLDAGSRYEGLAFVLEGSVDAEMRSYSGRAVAIETIKAPDAIATGVLFSRSRKLPVTVVAASPCRVLTLPEETVLFLLQRDRTILKNFLADIGSKLELFSERFRLLQFSSLRQKIASWLVARSADQGDPDGVTLPFTKEKLADFLAVARPSLSREMIAMETEGLIRSDGRKVAIPDMARLQALLEDDEGEA